MTNAYQKLKDELSLITSIQKALGILSWDEQVMMPPMAANERGITMATLGKIVHERSTAPQIKEWIDASVVSDARDVKNLKMIREDHVLATCLSGDFVFKMHQARSKCQNTWQEAKATSDWQKLLPSFRELVTLAKEEARLYGEALGLTPYNALMHLYAPGNSQDLVDPLFAALKEQLPPLIQKITARQPSTEVHFTITIDAQEKIGRDIAQKMGFSFDRGRLDRSAHPFSSSTVWDSRVTTRYSEEAPFSSLMGVMHEVGHSLYSQNVPEAWDDFPVGSQRDMTIHESQSLSCEVQAGLSDGFLAHAYETIIQYEPSFAKQGSLQDFKNTIRRVEPSFIRVDADEATYPLHVIMRYEIEKEIFNNDLDVAEIPTLWNAKFKALSGLDVPEHRFGCMQDIHWFSGSFGYFPTYTQGALYAAQLCAAMKRDIPDIDTQLSRGEFKNFIAWQTKNIHRWAQFYPAAELIEKATGSKPSAQFFLDHLTARYLG